MEIGSLERYATGASSKWLAGERMIHTRLFAMRPVTTITHGEVSRYDLISDAIRSTDKMKRAEIRMMEEIIVNVSAHRPCLRPRMNLFEAGAKEVDVLRSYLWYFNLRLKGKKKTYKQPRSR